MTGTCNNCGSKVSGNYCSNCGQRNGIGLMTYSELRGDLSQSLFSVEAPIVLTLKRLFLKPEVLFREYLGGARKKYYRPIAFFILMTALYLLVRSIIGFEARSSAAAFQDGNEDGQINEAAVFMVQNINKFLFLFVLGLGISLKVFFLKRQRLIEYWVISFYFVGVYTLLTLLGFIITNMVERQVQHFIMLLAFLYFIYCCSRFFEGNKILIGIKSTLAFIVAMIIYVMGSYGLSYLIVKYI
jgi:hypothetical protein